MKKKLFSLALAIALCLGLAVPASATPVRADSYQTVSAGQDIVYFIKEDNSLWCWGQNDTKAAIGNGTTDSCPAPVKIMDDVASVDVAGTATAIFKTDGSFCLWGTYPDNFKQINPVKLLENVSSVDLDDRYWRFTQEDGSFWTMGFLWKMGETHHFFVGGVSPEKMLDNVVSTAVNGNTVAAVTADGGLWTWGNNELGRLGDGSDESVYRSTPAKIMDGVASVSGGHYGAFLAVKKDGTLWSWGGHEDYNPRGDGKPDGSAGFTPVKIMDDVTYAHADSSRGCAIKKDGSVWCWGRRTVGSISPIFGEYESLLTPVKYLDGNVVKLYDNRLTLALKDDGTLWSWGDDESRLLGNGGLGNTDYPTKILDDVVDFSVSYFCAFALKKDGTVWAWGDAQYIAPDLVVPHKSVYVDTPRKCMDGAAALFCEGAWPRTILKKDGSLWVYVNNGGKPYEWYFEPVKIADNVRTPGQKPASVPTAPTASVSANPTSSTVLVNGTKTAFDAYNIAGSNYFKLRDLAYVLSGTQKQFEVSWDGTAKAISLTSGKPYTAVGGEMSAGASAAANAVPTAAKIFVDGREVSLTAYNIGGNNYFKLRDIGQTFDFGVGWDGASRTITIDTSAGYTK